MKEQRPASIPSVGQASARTSAKRGKEPHVLVPNVGNLSRKLASTLAEADKRSECRLGCFGADLVASRARAARNLHPFAGAEYKGAVSASFRRKFSRTAFRNRTTNTCSM